MRIAISNASHSWGGVHFVTKLLAMELQRCGHEIIVLCRPHSRMQQALEDVAPVRPVLNGMDLHPVTLVRVRRTLRSFAPDVVLLMTKKDVRLTGAAARALGVPVVVRHANDRPLRNALYHRMLYGWLPTHHIANSAATRSTLTASAPWLHADAITVIHNGIDPTAFDVAAAPLGLPAAAVTFGFFGRIEYRKGVMDLAAAWPAVTAAVPHAHLVIVGTGAEEAKLRAALQDRNGVHWLGHRTDVPAIMKAVDVVVMPSHWEGFGLVAAEGMAAGRPVIATNASSLPEIVRDGVDGLLVPPRAPEALAMAMIRLAGDAGLRAKMGEAGALRVRTGFSYDRMLDAYEALLARIAGSGATTPLSTGRPTNRSSR